jgi:hypothetical protein
MKVEMGIIVFLVSIFHKHGMDVKKKGKTQQDLKIAI